ncbi:unnamed protein product, partial [Vitis vinifera]
MSHLERSTEQRQVRTGLSTSLRAYKLQDLSLRDGSIEFPDKGISGRMRVPIRIFVATWWNREREGEDMAMMRRDEQRGLVQTRK